MTDVDPLDPSHRLVGLLAADDAPPRDRDARVFSRLQVSINSSSPSAGAQGSSRASGDLGCALVDFVSWPRSPSAASGAPPLMKPGCRRRLASSTSIAWSRRRRKSLQSRARDGLSVQPAPTRALPAHHRAARPTRRARARAGPRPRRLPPTNTSKEPPTAEESYRLPLALAYLAPLSLHVLASVRPFPESSLYTGLGLTGMLGAPFVAHIAHDNLEGGGMAALGTVSAIAGGAALGTIVLLLSNYDVCRDCDDEIGRIASKIQVGGYYGAAVGYLGWAFYDTTFNARVAQPMPRPDSRAHERSSMIPSVTPLVTFDGAGHRTLTGLFLGVHGAL